MRKIKQPHLKRSGDIRGDLSGLGPTLFISIRGMKGRSSEQEGIFLLGSSLGPGMMFHTGMLLPLSQCRNKHIRDILLSIEEINNSSSYCDFIEAADARLAQIEDYIVSPLVEDRSFGALALEPTDDCLRMLFDHFGYIEGILDDPDGEATPESYSRFRWTTYGSLMEWFHSDLRNDFGAWELVRIHLLFEAPEGVAALDMFRGHGEMKRPEIALDKFFQLKPGLEPSQAHFTSSVHNFGFGDFTIRIGHTERTLFLSDAYPPYEYLIRWLQEMECGNLPVRIEMEEEGPTTYLEAHPTGDDNLVLFVHGDKYAETVFIQNIVDRLQFVNNFREELAGFIKEAFDENKWDEPLYSHEKNLAETLLADPWLHGSRDGSLH